MTTYEKCKAIRQFIVNRAAEVMNYKWDDKFSTEQIRDTYESAKKQGISRINISELTSKQMDDLGFGKWSKDSPTRLIPLWLYQWLPDKIETECIDGKSLIWKNLKLIQIIVAVVWRMVFILAMDRLKLYLTNKIFKIYSFQ